MRKKISKRKLKQKEILEVTHFTLKDIREYNRINGYDCLDNARFLEEKSHE
jgi:hypothetical protein